MIEQIMVDSVTDCAVCLRPLKLDSDSFVKMPSRNNRGYNFICDQCGLAAFAALDAAAQSRNFKIQ